MADAKDPRAFLTAGQEAILRHWSTYGQRGTTPTRRAMPWDWDQTRFISPKSAKWHVHLKTHQLPLLLLGFVPADPANDQALIAQTFQVGETVETHGFMSASRDPNVKASEDKWFVYAVGPDAYGTVNLSMIRSWTGTKLIELKINAGKIDRNGNNGEETRITDIIWESDPGRWKDMDEKQAKEIAAEVCRWVLNVDFDEESFQQPTTTFDMLSEALNQIPPAGKMTVYSRR